ncbi:MAG: FlgD immunoglobulin-like domain containing protein, partial [Candidatus Eisenbacteria bacterium]
GASHEFGHVVWESNRSIHGQHSPHGNFNELFASASAILSNPPTGAVGYDKPYAQSLLYLIAGDDCTTLSPTAPANCPELADHQDCRTGYTTWGLWATYLAGHFHEQGYSDDVLYKWARVQDPPDTGRLRRDMCGLASVFDDPMYSYLGGTGGSPGGERLRRVFHDFSVAKWVDSAEHDTTGRYLFPEYSPRYDFGIFSKNDTVTAGSYNYWELPIPPIFTVTEESDGTWMSVPGNASDSLSGCTDGWNDPKNTSYCGNTYCDPVKVRLWGSYFIGFAADTSYYSSNDDRYLEIKLNWSESAMNDSTELWVSILKYTDYSATGDSLFLDGEYVKQVLTDQFAPGDSVVIVVPDFNEGGSEAAAVVLSLVPTVFDTIEVDCSGALSSTVCLPRRANSSASRDLEFTYSFIVTDGSEGSGGCPFAGVLTEDGYELDNNVLVGGTLGGDVEDYYVLDTEPILDEGVYRLRLTEDENDLSHFDRVSLLVADLPEGQELGVLEGRGLVAYTRTGSPAECRDETGASLLSSVSSDDGDRVVLPAGSWIDVHLPTGARAGGGAGTDGGPSHKIDPPLGGRAGPVGQGVLDLTPLCYRGNECTNIIPLPDGTPVEDGLARFRVSTSVDYYLDQLFSVEFADEAVRTECCRLISALHSDAQDVAAALSSGDGHTADLGRGEEIELAFAAPDLEPGRTRRFALVTQGRYEHLAGRLDDEVETDLPLALSATAYPNPFTPMTKIRFAIPSPGGDVSVRIYNMAGRLVRDLGRDDLPPGVYELEWDGRSNQGERVATGVYFYAVRTPDDSVRRKVVLLK